MIVEVEYRYKLNHGVKQTLKSMEPEFGFNGLGEVVFRRTYSRDNEDWADVVIRVIEGVITIRKNHYYKNGIEWNEKEWDSIAEKMALSMFKMEWLPPGRGLWMMGTPFVYERGAMALYNCFDFSTEFWTDRGLKKFSDFNDGDDVTVRGKNKWVNAKVKCFGKDRLWKLIVRKGSEIREIMTTENHRWIVKNKRDGSYYKTNLLVTKELYENLKLVSFVKRTNHHDLQICGVGIQHGIVFGDGTFRSNVNSCSITLCDNKKELSRYFSTPRKYNNTITGLPSTWKQLPSLDMNKEYLLGFIAGWFATDGYIGKNSCMSISNKDKDVLQGLRNILFKLDISTGKIRLSRTENPFTGEYSPLYSVSINREYVPESFFIRDDQRDRLKPCSNCKKMDWRVVSVEPTDRVEDVWCVVEPSQEEFTLECGILTKNCSATDSEKDFIKAAHWGMDCLMNGVGVGFNTNWKGKVSYPNKSEIKKVVIKDSREGWIDSVATLMRSFVVDPETGRPEQEWFPEFDYSKVRKQGEKIKGFGGTASGPKPLQDLHERIEQYFMNFLSDNPDYTHSRLVADVFNAIGACVVAGNVRRCLPSESMVHTEKGLKPINKVKVGDRVLTMDGYENVCNVFEQGRQQLVKIVTQDGDFRCTPNHRMAVCSSYDTYEWKEASSLKEGDRLISSRYLTDGVDSVLPTLHYEYSKHSTTCKEIQIPELDEDIAWLIGLFQGDGYVYPNYKKNGYNAYVSIVGGLNEFDVMYKAKQQLERFGKELHVTLKKRPNENSYIVHCQSKQLAWYFDKYIKQAKKIIRTPEFIFKSKPSIRLAYVAGITDADGCLKNRPIQVVSTVYEEFARDIQNILYSCGITTRLRCCSDNVPSRLKHWQQMFQVNLITKSSQRLFDSIPQLFKEMRKTSRSQNANGFPTSFENTSTVKTKFGLYSNKQINIDAYEKHYGYCDYTPVEVIKVVEDVEEDTWDIEVENRHEFFCNGYLTHNSAEICLGSADDTQFMNLKNYEKHPERMEIGWLSNNSVLLKDTPTNKVLKEMAQRISDNGEPGMLNLSNAQRYGRMGEDREDKTAILTNPCVTGDTLIPVADGRIVAIKDLNPDIDIPVYSINRYTGDESIKLGVHPRFTGNKPVVEISFTDGDYVKTTENHLFMVGTGKLKQACELGVGDIIPEFQHPNQSEPSLYNGGEFNFARQLCDHVSIDDWETREQSICLDCKNLQRKDTWKFNCGKQIKGVRKLEGIHPVYNITVDTNNTFAIITNENNKRGIYTMNCGEISLADKETCNLSEIFPTRCYGPEEFFNAIRYATLYSSTVALLPTHRRETNNIIMKNRRIGVSISGIAQWASGFNKEGWSKNMNYSEISKYLDNGYKIVRSENKRLARDAGVPKSIRVTTIKPSGTISLLAGVTPGIHFPVSRYAIRRIRVGTQSPIIDALINSNVPNEDDQYSANTKVFEFIIDHGPVRPCEEVSPWEQFALIRMVQKYWADNSVSATVYFDKEKCKPEEIQKMLDLYIPELKSVSMLPHSGHGYAQAPYEPLTEEEYNKRVEETKIDFSNTKGNVPSGSVYCTGDNCVRV